MIFSTELLIQTLISGVMVGILYALMALGITFIYSIVKTINWAMGEFYMIGSYIQYVVVAFLLGPSYWWLAVIISAAGTGLVGYLLEPILIKPMHARAMERRDGCAASPSRSSGPTNSGRRPTCRSCGWGHCHRKAHASRPRSAR